MNELRWILLAAGLVLIAGIYLWGLRARRRAAPPGHERAMRVEPARTVQVVAEPDPAEDDALIEVATPDDAATTEVDEPEEEIAPRRPPAAARREPRIEPHFDAGFEPATVATRAEPRLEPRPQARIEPRLEPQREAAEPAAPEPAPASRSSAPAESPRKPQSQKIVAVRVVAPAGGQFTGDRLLEAILADGFTFGRYQIFHRLDEAGRPLVSLASLKEPGTFDPEAMPGAQFRGVALFAVMPGPLPGMRSFDELIVTARALAATLGGQLQDERGSPLSLQRIGHLREEVAEFERSRGTAAPGA